MMAADEDALACDLAETYGIYDMRALPALRLATLSVGLRDESRIKMKLSDQKAPLDKVLQAAMVDRLTWLAWAQTKDGQNGKNRPEQLVAKLMGTEEEKETQNKTYESAEEFEAERQRIINEVKKRWQQDKQ